MAIGDLVATLSVPGETATFALSSNPGGFFAISGNNLMEAIDAPAGIYPITVTATGPGVSITQPFILDFSGSSFNFFLGLNLSGLEDTGGTPSAAEMAYWSNLGIKKFRIPLNWFQLQPVAYGPISTQPYLNTGGTYFQQISSVLASAAACGAQVMLDFHNFGSGPSKNALANSAALAQAPWGTGALISPLPTITANAALAPDGLSMTATKVVMPSVTAPGAVSGISYNQTNLEAATVTWSIDLQGAVGGEVVWICVANGSATSYLRQKCVLTTSWQRFSFTGTPPGGGGGASNFFEIGTDLRDSGQTSTSAQTFYVDWAQDEYGSAATSFASTGALGTGYLIGTPNLPIDALGAAWVAFSAKLRADPNFSAIWAYDFMNEWHNMDALNLGSNSNAYSQNLIFSCNQNCLTQLRAAGDNTLSVLEWDHFDGAWDAVTNNIVLQLAGIVDPANNWVQSVHCYLDQDSSGTHSVWSEVIAATGSAPPGLNVTVNIGPQRMAAVVALCQSHGVNVLLGETGFTTDCIYVGGANDYADWNQAGLNMISYCQANNIPVFPWSSGPGFPVGSYAYNPAPFLAGFPFVKAFAGGVQGSQVVVYEQFTGYAEPQPTAYTSAIGPAGVNPYAPSGTPITGLFNYYGGVVPATVTFTGIATLMDGVTDAGGTFSAISYPAGNNGLASFTYTPSGSHPAINLTFTNNTGLTNPPAIGVSSQADFFNTTLGALAPNIYALRLLNTSYIGPAVTLQRSDGAEKSFRFTLANSGSILGLDRVAIQNWAGSQVIPIVGWSGQGGNDLAFNATSVFLVLDDGTGYPSVHTPNGPLSPSGSIATNFVTPSIGQGQLSIYAEVKPASGSVIVSQDEFSGTFRLTPSGFNIGPNGSSTTNGIAVSAAANVWTPIAVTYSNLYGTNNLKSYASGTLSAQNNATIFTNNSAQNTATFGNFQFFPEPMKGSYRALILQYLEYSSGNFTTLETSYTSYYSTPLPDSPLPPVFAGVANQNTVSGHASAPFAGFTLDDAAGSTDTIVFTLSGQAATLSGTGLTGSNPYTLTSDTTANINTKLQALQFLSTGSIGAVTNIAMVATSNTGGNCSASPTVTIAAAQAPVISGLVAPQVSMDQGAPPLWQVSVTDPNPSPMVSATITITGAAGTLSHLGPTAPSGTGPYTFAADTPANLTRWLRNLLWLPSVTTSGTVTTFALQVTNALGVTASATNTIANVAPQAMPTPFTPVNTPAAMINPSGTNRGMNFSGTENTGSSQVPQIFEGTYAWAAAQEFGTIRWPFLFSNNIIHGSTNQLYADFNATQIGYAHTAIEWARKYGQWLKFDDHAFGGVLNPFNTGTSDDGVFCLWGGDIRTPASAFADCWKRMASYFSLYSNMQIGLQNECMNNTPSNTTWRANATAATTAIRTVLPSVLIELPSAANTASLVTSVWTGYTDTGPFRFGVHQYYDNAGGTQNTCVSALPSAYWSGITTWARANGYQVSVSEWATGTDTTCIPTLLDDILAYFNTNNDVYPDWQWWGGGDFPTSYVFYMGPESGGGNPPQYALLSPYLP